jgi:amino-acid N-acetyltransferase
MSAIFNFTFVPWFRSVAPYIHMHRGKTFVVGMAGEAVAAGKLQHIAQDLALIQSMGVKVVLVHGFRPQVSEQLQAKGHAARYSHGMRITDGVALDCAQGPPASCATRSRPPSARACPTRRWPAPRCA